MVGVKIETKANATINGYPIDEVLKVACEMAHQILYDESSLKDGSIEVNEDLMLPSSGDACKFLDMIGD